VVFGDPSFALSDNTFLTPYLIIRLMAELQSASVVELNCKSFAQLCAIDER